MNICSVFVTISGFVAMLNNARNRRRINPWAIIWKGTNGDSQVSDFHT